MSICHLYMQYRPRAEILLLGYSSYLLDRSGAKRDGKLERKEHNRAILPLESPRVVGISFLQGHLLLTPFVEGVGLPRTGSRS